jgi:large subunit ribosomal protein L18
MKSTTLLNNKRRNRRKNHVRRRIRDSSDLPRLCVVRSCKHISAQIVHPTTGRTLTGSTSTAKALAEALAGKTKTERAALIGAEIAKKAKDVGVEQVVFDRGSSKYHGRVKALADAAREAGLRF